MTGLRNLLWNLIGAFLLLEISSATTQSDTPPQTNCNSCCHGPAGVQGTPGIPGVPGTNGMPGNLGPKGDRGESIKGDKGDSIKGDAGIHGMRGESGGPGLKGERGADGLRGLPGKIGPQGSPGQIGSPGIPGVKGQKGEMGRSRISAFTAVIRSSFTPSTAGLALPFGIMHTNVGEDFNAESGHFTCEVPGIYMFTYNVLTHTGNSFISLMKNSGKINSIYRQSQTFTDMIGNAAVLELEAGDQVWLKCNNAGHKIYDDGDQYGTFTGVLIHEM